MKSLTIALFGLLAAEAALAGPLEELAGRVAPDLAGRVRFRVDRKAKAVTVAPSGRDGIAITAPEPRLAAAGLGLYLREVADAHWSWCGNRLEGPWPVPNRTLTFTPAYPHVQAYNYCTLSYTMAFWDQAAWREELDRLALFGVEMPLVQAGLQRVWQLTLREVGYPEARIAAFLPDEAAAAWWNMGNLEGLGGPLPQAAIDRNAEIGRFIVQEAMALGMRPILQAFTGLVPHDLGEYLDKKRFPDARFVGQGTWCDGFVRPAVLDPTTQTFHDLAAIWYRNLFAVYGIERAEYFAGDLFHEGGRTGGLDVTACARAVQAAQQAAAPGARWLVQAWGANPRDALLKGLDPELTIIEYLARNQSSDNTDCRAYGDIPWLWCELINFGGRQGLYGGLPQVGKLGNVPKSPGGKTLAGYGFISEGLETNPMYYELFAERFFMPADKVMDRADLTDWLALYATRRYGLCTPALHDALVTLLDSVHTYSRDQEASSENVLCARPSWTANKVSTWSTGSLYYAPAATLRAAEAYLHAARTAPALLQVATFRYDLANVTRQALADLARPLLAQAKADPAAREAFLKAIAHTEAVLAQEPRFRLDWHEARAARQGGEAAARAYRRMVTTWTGRSRGSLNDYAYRQLAGLMAGYYGKRWALFFANPDPKAIADDLEALNRDFEVNGAAIATPTRPLADDVADALAFARDCHARWANAFDYDPGTPWDLAADAMTLDVSDAITQAGTYTATIQWKSGPHALKIEKVELFEDDTLVAADAHPGYTGLRTKDNVYTLRLPAYRENLSAYTLRITATGDGGDRSAGVAIVRRVGD